MVTATGNAVQAAPEDYMSDALAILQVIDSSKLSTEDQERFKLVRGRILLAQYALQQSTAANLAASANTLKKAQISYKSDNSCPKAELEIKAACRDRGYQSDAGFGDAALVSERPVMAHCEMTVTCYY